MHIIHIFLALDFFLPFFFLTKNRQTATGVADIHIYIYIHVYIYIHNPYFFAFYYFLPVFFANKRRRTAAGVADIYGWLLRQNDCIRHDLSFPGAPFKYLHVHTCICMYKCTKCVPMSWRIPLTCALFIFACLWVICRYESDIATWPSDMSLP